MTENTYQENKVDSEIKSDTVKSSPSTVKSSPSTQNLSKSDMKLALKKMNYVQGKQLLSLKKKPKKTPEFPFPKDPAQALKMAQESIDQVSIGATLGKEQVLYSIEKEKAQIDIVAEIGTQFYVSLNSMGLHFNADPGIWIKTEKDNGLVPDFRLSSISWNFDKAKFDFTLSASWDVFGQAAGHVQQAFDNFLNTKFKLILPKKIQKPGYSPKTDPDLTKTTEEMQNMLGKLSSISQKLPKSSPSKSKDDITNVLIHPTASLDFTLHSGMKIPLGTPHLVLDVDPGTQIRTYATTRGKLLNPVIEEISIEPWRYDAGTGPGYGVVIRHETGLFSNFKEIRIKKISILKGGKFYLDYKLAPEEFVEGLYALGQILDMARGNTVYGKKDVKMEKIRAELDKRLQQEVPPKLKALLKQYDRFLPGVSLMSIFGI